MIELKKLLFHILNHDRIEIRSKKSFVDGLNGLIGSWFGLTLFFLRK